MMADNPQNIRQLVRRVVYRTLGMSPGEETQAARRMVTEEDLRGLPFGAAYQVPRGALITPLARQVAMERKLELVASSAPAENPAPSAKAVSPPGSRVVALGADHGGFAMKQDLLAQLADWGYGTIDCGTNSTASVDYPDFALAVAQLVASGKAWRGIVIDGAGIGSCIAANKVPGVRAAMCYDQATAVNSREHNDANVLSLGAGLLGTNLARQIAKTWLETDFAGGRHARRVRKIEQIEQRYLR